MERFKSALQHQCCQACGLYSQSLGPGWLWLKWHTCNMKQDAKDMLPATNKRQIVSNPSAIAKRSLSCLKQSKKIHVVCRKLCDRPYCNNTKKGNLATMLAQFIHKSKCLQNHTQETSKYPKITFHLSEIQCWVPLNVAATSLPRILSRISGNFSVARSCPTKTLSDVNISPIEPKIKPEGGGNESQQDQKELCVQDFSRIGPSII